MFDQSQIARGVFAATVAYDLVINYRNKRKYLKRHIEDVNDYNNLVDRHNVLQELLAQELQRSSYLASMLDEHEIDLDEFDIIAITNPI